MNTAFVGSVCARVALFATMLLFAICRLVVRRGLVLTFPAKDSAGSCVISISTRVVTLSVAMAATAVAQTPVEYDTIKHALSTVMQKGSSSLATLDAASRPSNWQSLIMADMDAAIAAAAIASNAARTATSGRFTFVRAGGDLQSAIDSALPGDTIVLQAGATYTGMFLLPAKSGTGYVTITTSALAGLPEGQRVGPVSAVFMPRIVNATGGTAFLTAAGAHHYKTDRPRSRL
jgi:hypothetical protein